MMENFFNLLKRAQFLGILSFLSINLYSANAGQSAIRPFGPSGIFKNAVFSESGLSDKIKIYENACKNTTAPQKGSAEQVDLAATIAKLRSNQTVNAITSTLSTLSAAGMAAVAYVINEDLSRRGYGDLHELLPGITKRNWVDASYLAVPLLSYLAYTTGQRAWEWGKGKAAAQKKFEESLD